MSTLLEDDVTGDADIRLPVDVTCACGRRHVQQFVLSQRRSDGNAQQRVRLLSLSLSRALQRAQVSVRQ